MEKRNETKQVEMEYFHEDFVGVYKNAFSKEWCNEVIKYFDNMNEAGFSTDRQQWQGTPKMMKEDDSLNASFENEVDFTFSKYIHSEFLDKFWENIYPLYANNYSALDDLASHMVYSQKIQKTKIGGGYHVWHCEQSDRGTANRILTFVLYLNDVEEGGETEFLYQGKRVSPEAGTVVIFPASFTHTHRGNPPLSNEKYLLTGWVEF